VEVPITEFRRQIFSLVNQALDGEEVWFTHKGRRIKIVPEGQPTSRLSRITPVEIINPEISDLLDATRKAEMMAEIQKAWEKDWEEL
jgi:antitoxin (DNA-binding transcriptional repressor) of toxin-antitoxin stability system